MLPLFCREKGKKSEKHMVGLQFNPNRFAMNYLRNELNFWNVHGNSIMNTLGLVQSK